MENYFNQLCPVCHKTAKHIAPSNNLSGTFINCNLCGRYFLDETYLQEQGVIQLPYKMRSVLYYYLTEISKKERETPPFFCNRSGNRKKGDEQKTKMIIHYDALENIYPTIFYDQASMILVNLYNLTRTPGDRVFIPSNFEEAAPIFLIKERFDDTPVWDQIIWWQNALAEKGFVKKANLMNELGVVLTLDGVEVANKTRTDIGFSITCFVAMCFWEEMFLAREKICEAITSTGYVPILIDEKEHNNQIVPEILYEIKKSRFVVADFTKQRGGVYYEAGFAAGCGKQVIALCSEQEKGKVHFDIQQKSTIFWKDEEDLAARLKRRIEATIGLREKTL